MGSFNPDGSLNTNGSPAANNVFQLAQLVVLNYMALHSSGAAAAFPSLYPPSALANTLGSGSALDSLIAYQPLPGLTNGTVTG
jgi:hypothetical protein